MATKNVGTADHEITIEPFVGSVNVSFGDARIASTKRALLLKEANHQPVFYIPFDDIYFEHLLKTDTSSKCPYKGTASYWGVSAVGQGVPDVMWAYETPIAAVASIAGYGAFYANKVGVEAVKAEPDPLIGV